MVWRESLEGVAQRALPAREGPQRQRARRGQPLQLEDRLGLLPGRMTGLIEETLCKIIKIKDISP